MVSYIGMYKINFKKNHGLGFAIFEIDHERGHFL